MAHKTKAERAKLAKLITQRVAKKKMTISEALIESGYSPTQAKRGWDTVPTKVREIVGKKRCTMIEKGRRIASSPELARDMVLGRLATNVEHGKDGGTASAKALGNWRELDLFTPNIQQGVIILNVPSQIANMTPEQRKQLIEGDE